MKHRSLRILMVEDDDLDVQLFKTKFRDEKVANEIDVCYNVATALEYLGKQQPIDLIFLDLNLPMGEPTDIIKYVKSVSCYAKTIITAVTASSDLKDVIAMQELGVKNYITKPLNFEKMNQIVKSIPEFYWLAVTPDQSAA